MVLRFVGDAGGKFKVAHKNAAGQTIQQLIWGDPVQVLQADGDLVKVKARSKVGWVDRSVLVDEGLLEIYVIDVGQGDGVLMRTPDDAWHLIDGGVSNEQQMTRKGTANFVRWKFIEDLGKDRVTLKNVVLTHPDFDHYGGLINLLQGRVMRPPRTFDVVAENFYHCGLGRFASGERLGRAEPGTVANLPANADAYGIKADGNFIVELLSGKASFTSPPRPFEPAFEAFADMVAKFSGNVRRLSQADAHLPGYEAQGQGKATIHLLGPVLETLQGEAKGLRKLGTESETRNGHSIVLRVDYGKVRILLTGDLNTASQRLLMSYHDAREFACDVVKGCHHGSDDIDLRFVRAMSARATVVSSGDNEDYAHPRPRVLGASARYGREAKGVKGETLPPLLYSTELARSVKLDYASAVRKASGEGQPIKAEDAQIKAAARGSEFVALDATPISTDLIYGLINVRTDGERVMCAYMKEQGTDFDIQAFRAGVEP